MGFMTETVLLKTTENGFKGQAELLAQLLAEQQRTNLLLTQLVQALQGRPSAGQTTTWGTR